MKKIVFFMILPIGLFLALLFVGCKEPIIDPPEPPEKFIVVVEPSDTVMNVGDTARFRITTTADSVEIHVIGGEIYQFSPTHNVEFYFLLPVEKEGLTVVWFYFFKREFADEPYVVKNLNSTITGIPVAPKFYTLVADPDTLPFGGGTSTISWTSDADSVRCPDGQWVVGSSGSIEVEVVTDSTLGFLAMKGLNQSLTKVEVIVLPALTNTDLIKDSRGWHVISFETRESETDHWDSVYVSPDIINEIKYFYDNNYYEVFRDGVLIGNGTWFFLDNETKISIGGVVYDIQTLNEIKLVLTFITPCPGCPSPEVFARLTFVHPVE